MNIRTPLVLCLLVMLLAACEKAGRGGSLEQIRERGSLIVLTRNAPTTYYEGRDGLTGLEYEMATAFAEHLGVEAEFRVMETLTEILRAIEEGKGDVAAAGLTHTARRSNIYLAGPTYQTVEQQVVCRRGGKQPTTVEALADVSITVVAKSSYVERLEDLRQTVSELDWEVTDELGTEQLLEKVWNNELDCTIADSNITSINRRYFPELVVAFNLTEPEPLAWLLPPQAKELKGAIDNWFDEYNDDGEIEQLLEKYYGFIEIFDYVDTRAFVRRIDSVLPHYQALFRKVGTEHGVSWTMLAAQAYQESHWKPRAKSPTGVKGIMMLTRPTAKEVGVENRLNPEQSINGGAKYLSRLRDRLPKEIEEPDRTWIALAAYNVGMGHLWDARTLAKRRNKNPRLWSDLAEVFPLLAQKKYYRTLKHGYARGREPVRYVNRIRNYRDILEQTIASP